jgi:hypothetical protein
LSSGSRYGSSSSRNNFTPVLTDEFSSGPFGFERIFLTGSAPVPFSIHEEPQTQMLYKFKADYFHVTGMLDPNVILVGTRYKWSKQDIPSPNDDRSSEIGDLEFGFDYGSFALNAYAGGVVDTGIRLNDQFVENSGNLPRLGLTYRNYLFGGDVQGGSGTYDQFKFGFFRFNAEVFFIKQWDFTYSLIYKTMDYSDPTKFVYSSNSFTNALYASYSFSYKFSMSAFLSFESFNNKYGLTSLSGTSSNLYPKAGVYGALSF